MVEIKLKHPIVVSGQRVEALAMRRPKVRDLRVARTAGADILDQDILLMATLCEVPPETIHELDVTDWDQVNEEYDRMTPERPAEDDLRRGMMIIARELNQPLSEVEALDIDEFLAWLLAIKKERDKARQ